MWWPSMDNSEGERRHLLLKVATALSDGDLGPLAEFFRAGYSDIGRATALELADMIDSKDGRTPFKLKEPVGRTSRPGGWTDWMEEHDRNMQIGLWTEARCRKAKRGERKTIIFEASERFGVTEDKVERALKLCRTTLKRMNVKAGFDVFESYAQDYGSLPLNWRYKR